MLDRPGLDIWGYWSRPRFWDFLLYIETSAICVKNSDGRGLLEIRCVWAARGALKLG